jgi:predicted dehydrogenase
MSDTTQKTFRWAIHSTGFIAHQFAQGLKAVPNAQLYAVSSRTQAGADKFAEEFDVIKAYEGLPALLQDQSVDIVYIASPHMNHVEDSIACLEAGKHVLCEKPMAMNVADVDRVLGTAKKQKRFFMEAMWTHCFPVMEKVKNLLDQGAIGDVRFIDAAFCNNVPFDASNRFYNKELGGGAILDLGIYPLALADFVKREFPTEIVCQADVGKTGVDEHTHMSLKYEDGTLASLKCSFQAHVPSRAAIYGTDGSIVFPKEFWRPTVFEIHKENKETEVHEISLQGNGYNYEALEVQRCIHADCLESELVPHSRSLRLMRQMQDSLQQLNITYSK